MRNLFLSISVLLVLLLLGVKTVAQDIPVGEKFELLSADVLIGDTYNGQEIRKLIGNVKFKKQNGYLDCDSAYQYVDKNDIEAYSRVKLTQGDSLVITGDSLFYNSTTKMARLRGNIKAVNKNMTLKTRFLDYDMGKKVGYFYNNGVITDPKNNLVCEKGFFYTETDMMVFKEKVVLTNPEYTITSNDLEYNTSSKISYLKGPSDIKTKDGNIYTENGTYNTETDVANFTAYSKIVNKDFEIEALRLYYEQNTGYGFAQNKVKMLSLADSFIITGNEAKYWEHEGKSKVYGNAVFISVSGKDSMFLMADTLFSVEKKDTVNKTEVRNLFAYRNCTIYKSDFQAKCDSLSYLFSDSSITFFRKPVLWSEQTQITADTLKIQLANDKIDKLYLRRNSFLISQDTLRNYNQIKGKNMLAQFNNNEIKTVYVYENGESIYFALEEDKEVIGMNVMQCKNMVMQLDSNELKRVNFIDKPKAKFIPPHEIKDNEAFLKGFIWRRKERPARNQVRL